MIAAVNGPAAGIGCSIALAADFVIAGSSAYFLQPVIVGFVLDGGSSWMLPRLSARRRRPDDDAGREDPGEEAERIGLIYRASPTMR